MTDYLEGCAAGGVPVYPASGFDNYTYRMCVTPTVSAGFDFYDAPSEDVVTDHYGDMDIMWLLICGAMVFLMQAGFSMLEAGSISKKNTVNILFKNLLDACFAALTFWAVGYGFATGETSGGFIGTTNFFLSDIDNETGGYEGFFFQFAFAATAATIVSGSVAERTKLTAYFVYSIIITSFIYPVVVHWVWNTGFLSAFQDTPQLLYKDAERSVGLIDFAGSGVVHMVGGVAGLAGAYVVGPRKGRFEVLSDGSLGEPKPMPGHSMVLNSLGVIILWFGWFGFNGGSTLCAGGCMALAAKVCVNTVLAAAGASVTATGIAYYFDKVFDISIGLNAVIGGLVSITAGCPVLNPFTSFVTGVIGGAVYLGSDYIILNKLKIDDPLQASALHGACGAWGLLAVGMFATAENIVFGAYPTPVPEDVVSSGQQFLVQFIGMLCIFTWTISTSMACFLGIKYTIGMRVSEEMEESGLDSSEHGAASYALSTKA